MTVNKNSPFRRTTRRRILARIVPLALGAALVVGAIGTIFSLATLRGNVLRSQASQLDSMTRVVDTRMSLIREELLEVAESSATRQFARSTLLDLTGMRLDQAQQEMLRVFFESLSTHSDNYIAVRYVTYTGAIWTEANVFEGVSPRGTGAVDLDAFSGTEFEAVVNAEPGEVFVSAVDSWQGDTSVIARLTPYLRFSTPVGESGLNSNAGIIQMDVLIAPILADLQRAYAIAVQNEPGQRLMLVDEQDHIIFDTGAPSRDFLRELGIGAQTDIVRTLPQIGANIATQSSGEGDGYLYTSSHIAMTETTNWRIIYLNDSALVQQQAISVAGLNLGLSLIAGLVLIVMLNEGVRRVLRPLDDVALSGGKPVSRSAAVSGDAPDDLAHLIGTLQANAEKAARAARRT
ncbi:MAG: hypothetical protein HC828_10435 [Blastochloris sp.]|nr:hypothetical protein [Blastochloris sp.]